MSRRDSQQLQRLLGTPALAFLLDRLQRELEREKLADTLSFKDLPPASRAALEGLLGKPPSRARQVRVRVAQLETVLRHAGLADNLRDAVEQLRGPLRQRHQERQRYLQAWDQVFREQAGALATAQQGIWLDSLRRDGLLKRLSAGDIAQGRDLLRQALAVMERLPASGLSLSHLAAQALGDAHGLDAGQPLASLLRRYLRQLSDADSDEQDDEDARTLWANAGVLLGGGVTSRVLCLNLPASGCSGTARSLRILAESGQPALLSLRQLVSDPPAWRCREQPVFICENPAVLAAAADRLGPQSAPLICSEGQPSSALQVLLHSLGKAGAQLRYHGDFDWPGVSIANGLMRRHRIQAWRFDAASYRQAPASSKPLSGPPTSAQWDDELASVMQERGMAVEEELVLETLLQDLTD